MSEFKIPLEVLRAFGRDDWQNLVIAYDFDDILHPLVAGIVQYLGLDIKIITDFNFEKCLPPDLAKEALRIAYSNSIYDNIQFFPGVEDILRPQLEFGIPVEIRTNSTSDFVSKTKFEQLRARVPDLREDNFYSTVITHGQHQVKTYSKRTIITVDDCPRIIANSPAPLAVTMRWPWNTTQEAVEIMLSKRVRWCDTLHEVNQEIYKVVKSCLVMAGRKRHISR